MDIQMKQIHAEVGIDINAKGGICLTLGISLWVLSLMSIIHPYDI